MGVGGKGSTVATEASSRTVSGIPGITVLLFQHVEHAVLTAVST